jgi:DNA topoisomerase-1
LWRKVKGGLSAGRVQSVAVRIICERERAIQVFIPEEYWSITAHLNGETPPPFTAKLTRKDGEKIKVANEAGANEILDAVRSAPFIVDTVVKKTTRRNPQPPFITSKLQQESIRKLKFSAKKTMVVAQQLYEGIELSAGEPVGLITYMRTDSTRIADEAAQEALTYIRTTLGDDYANDKPREFKNRKKAQDAHEAIRPTAVENTPEKVAPYLSKEQQRLYALIWKRFVASQMKQALIDQVLVGIKSDLYTFNASGSSVKFKGFMALYQSVDEEAESAKKKQPLPELKEGQVLTLEKLDPKQHFTQPPPRFSEASLVKELEENGIGRPSTYAAILSTIRDKGYVELLRGYFRPTELGFIVNDLLLSSFPRVFDVNFTAQLEDNLDQVESAEAESTRILREFYTPFKEALDTAAETMLSVKGVGLATGLKCPQCNAKELHIKMGKNGHFLACSGYPECTFSRDYVRDEQGKIEIVQPSTEEVTDKTCAKCGQPMVLKRGKYGEFLACSGYPDCKHTQSVHANGAGKEIGVACPTPDCEGQILEKRSKRGKLFYGCNRFPDCDFASWDKPVAAPCPNCGATFLVEKTTKRAGTFLKCQNKECGYRQAIGDAEGQPPN